MSDRILFRLAFVLFSIFQHFSELVAIYRRYVVGGSLLNCWLLIPLYISSVGNSSWPFPDVRCEMWSARLILSFSVPTFFLAENPTQYLVVPHHCATKDVLLLKAYLTAYLIAFISSATTNTTTNDNINIKLYKCPAFSIQLWLTGVI